ncbi:hypothetical protein ABW20_dc0105124 [Dactylellina cionopaga]|nr:hypothetical protein ABW20_dc0105124 [Dactylellina cionopaga]
MQIKLSFPSIKIYLMVGIGGGIPSTTHDVRLGDIVVSKPENNLGGVVQYDLGKTVTGGGFERTGALNKPPLALLTAIGSLKATHELEGSKIPGYLVAAFSRSPNLNGEYSYQGRENDVLYKAKYNHAGGLSCESCHYTEMVYRRSRKDADPAIHYGIIASGNQVIKDGVTRDRLGSDVGAICFEMEAAGLMDHFPCLVIRGICDYSDSHKNKRWQPYAALTAAAYAKELLYEMAPQGATSPSTSLRSTSPQSIFSQQLSLQSSSSLQSVSLQPNSQSFSSQPTSLQPTPMLSTSSIARKPTPSIARKPTYEKAEEPEAGILETTKEPMANDRETPKEPMASVLETTKEPIAKDRETSKEIFGIPSILRWYFSGRQTYLSRIYDSLNSKSDGREGAIVSVHGISGVGKSQLCLKYAEDNRSEYDYQFYAIGSTAG